MRRLLIPLLLASAAAATPAPAAPGDGDRHHDGGERQARSESRSEHRQSSEPRRSERSAEVNKSSSNDSGRVRSFSGNVQHVPQGDSADSVRNWRGAEGNEARARPAPVESSDGSHPGPGMRVVQDGSSDGGSRSGGRIRVVENGEGGGTTESTADRRTFWRQRVKDVSTGGDDSGPVTRPGSLVQPERTPPRVLRTRVPVVSDTPREGTQPPLRTDSRRTTSHHRWSGDWRRDHRYDWWNWRRHHRSHFHLGFYFDPFGWNYRRYDIGWRLWPAYYSSRFWIDDPWSYRLPYAPPGYRWIRYYDDLILVDTWDGRVVDVIYNFFW